MPVHLINMHAHAVNGFVMHKKGVRITYSVFHAFSSTEELRGDQSSNFDVQVRFIKWEHFPCSRFRTGELSASGPTAASCSQPAVSSRACRCLSQDICTVLASQFIILGIGSLS